MRCDSCLLFKGSGEGWLPSSLPFSLPPSSCIRHRLQIRVVASEVVSFVRLDPESRAAIQSVDLGSYYYLQQKPGQGPSTELQGNRPVQPQQARPRSEHRSARKPTHPVSHQLRPRPENRSAMKPPNRTDSETEHAQTVQQSENVLVWST